MKAVLPATGLPVLNQGFLWSTTAGDVVCIRARRKGEAPPETWLLEQYVRRGVRQSLGWWLVKRGDHIAPLTPLRAQRMSTVFSLDRFTQVPSKGPGAPRLRPPRGAA